MFNKFFERGSCSLGGIEDNKAERQHWQQRLVAVV